LASLWLRLAAAREREHPDKSAAVYLRQSDFARDERLARTLARFSALAPDIEAIQDFRGL
jgi:hypothetical protein